MAFPGDGATAVPLYEACGLVQPASGWWAWLRDAHVAAALVAAVPVWLALAAWAGGRMQPVVGWSALTSFLLVMPFTEEIVFRGVLQGQLLRLTSRRRAGPLTWANLWTTAAFVAMHVPRQPLLWALAVALPSLVFGHLRERFGSVLPALCIHVTYNAGFALAAGWAHG
jgi:CAAX protease family protein